jgi:hypothetical protein
MATLMTDREMFGCEPTDFMNSVKASTTYKFSGANMVVASMLSDVQHMLEYGHSEDARKHLNLAKLMLFNIDEGFLVGKRERA